MTDPYNKVSDTLDWLLSDQLGSTTITANANGTFHSELRYNAWGQQRYASGITPTNDQYTGQYGQPEIGLDFYNARWYDSSLGRWASPDSVVQNPNNFQDWDRYEYVHNSPVVNNDPSGHCGQHGVVSDDAGNMDCPGAAIPNASWYMSAAGDASQDEIGPAGPGTGTSSENPPVQNAENPPPSLPNNPVPNRLARVFSASIWDPENWTPGKIGPPNSKFVFVTNPSDIAGITNARELTMRLSLTNPDGSPLLGPLVVLEFDTPESGIMSPINVDPSGTNAGFHGNGLTAGGAAEFYIPNEFIMLLNNLTHWIVP